MSVFGKFVFHVINLRVNFHVDIFDVFRIKNNFSNIRFQASICTPGTWWFRAIPVGVGVKGYGISRRATKIGGPSIRHHWDHYAGALVNAFANHFC